MRIDEVDAAAAAAADQSAAVAAAAAAVAVHDGEVAGVEADARLSSLAVAESPIHLKCSLRVAPAPAPAVGPVDDREKGCASQVFPMLV